METFEAYIESIFERTGINEEDKEELEWEIRDHLMLLKEDYKQKGMTEEKAIELAIKDFGEESILGKNIKENLPSHNKYDKLRRREKIKGLTIMFLIYFVFIGFCATLTNKGHETLFFNMGLALIVTLTAWIFINRKLKDRKEKIKGILTCNGIFILLEKIGMSLFLILSIHIKGGSDSIPHLLKDAYLFNTQYVISFVVFTIGFVCITKYVKLKSFFLFQNHYEQSTALIVLFSIAILLSVTYALFPNRFYILQKFVAKLIGTEITTVNKNLFFLWINEKIIVPNVGLLLLIGMMIRGMVRKSRVGVKKIA